MSKVWLGRRLINALLGLLASCECNRAVPIDAGIDSGLDSAVIDAQTPDAGTDGGPDSGPGCLITPGNWRFTGTGAPPSCGMFEFNVVLSSFADARGSRECTAGCSCASTIPSDPSCALQWSETCPGTMVSCTFDRINEAHITGRCVDGVCDVSWSAVPHP